MLFALYTATAILVLWLAHRFVLRLSRWAMLFLYLAPLALTGYPLIANRAMGPIDGSYIGTPLSVIRLQRGVGDPHNLITTDIYTQMIPWRHAVREAVRHGEWPVWNPYILAGDILAASSQPAPYSPVTLIALLVPAALSFTLTSAITFLLAALGAFLFARELGCRESTSAVGAAVWMYSNGIAFYVLWPLALCWTFFPFVLLGARRVVTEPGVRAWALLTTSLTLLVLAGHPETALHVVALGCVYALFELRRKNVLRAFAAGLAAGIVALLLCAIYLLPIAEAIPQSAEHARRSFLRSVDFLDKPPYVLVSLATDVFPFLHSRRWSDPPGAGVKAETAAVGSIGLALAIYAVIRIRSRTTWFFGAMGLLCMLAQAAWPPLMWTFKRIPLFDMTYNERLSFAAACCLALLAALGAEEIVRRRDYRFAAATLTIVLILLTAGTIWLMNNAPVAPMRAWGEYRVSSELLFLPIAALLLVLRVPLRVTIPAIVALVLVQRVMSEGGAHKSFPAAAAYPPMKIFEPLKQVREPFRVTGFQISLIPGTNALYGLEDVRGYESTTFLPLYNTYPLWSVPEAGFFNQVHDLTRPFLSMMNVRFAFAPQWIGVPPGWRLVSQQRFALLLENMNALDRAFVPRTVKLGLDDQAAIEEMKSQWDFRERAWIAAGMQPYERASGPGRVTAIRRPRAGAYDLDVEMDGDGWVVVSDSAWSGWRAYLDGKPVKTHRANVAFLSVYVPQGRHRVELKYWPESFVRGRAITFATLAGIVVFALLRSARARWRARPRGPIHRRTPRTSDPSSPLETGPV